MGVLVFFLLLDFFLVNAFVGPFKLPSFIESVISSPKTPKNPKPVPPVTTPITKSRESSVIFDLHEVNGEGEDEFDDDYPCEYSDILF